MPGKMDSFKALSAQDKRHAVVNWLLDHAMIIIILLLAVYVQIQRPQFFGVPSLVLMERAALAASEEIMRRIPARALPAVSCLPVRT